MTESRERIDRSGVDIVLLRTFLEVARTRHFGRTADLLFITQSAVSARIKLLESTLGVDLFTRRRHDIQLTAAGRRLQPHAETIVRSWALARAEIAIDARDGRAITVGAQADLWPILVRRWGLAVRGERPDLALGVELLPTQMLLQGVRGGWLDLAFLIEPPSAADLHCQLVARIALRLVAAQPGLSLAEASAGEYLYVDWGQTFATAHRRELPQLSAPAWRLSHGLAALDLLRQGCGSAYLPEPLVADALARGELHAVAAAPVLACSVQIIWSPQIADPELIADTLHRLRADG